MVESMEKESEGFNWKASYGLAILSGILLLLSYPPFNLEFLAWFAFVPFLIAIYYETKAKRRGRLAQVTAICLTPVFLWLCSTVGNFLPMGAAWPLGVIVAFFATHGIVVEVVDEYYASRQLPPRYLPYLPSGWQFFILPIVATAGEFLLMNIPVVMKFFGAIGFFSVSRTQWLNPPILQVASFTGMYGVTFLVWLVNSALAYGIVHYREARRVSKQAVAALLVFIIVFVCCWISLPGATTGDTTVVIIQAKPETMERQQVNELYADLSGYSLKYEPEIILWPMWLESDLWWEKRHAVGPFAEEYASFSQENDVCLTDGVNTVFPDGRVRQYAAPYHFIHLFDGLVPFDPDKIVPELHGFRTRSGKFGLLGCMESAYTVPTRQWVKDGARFVATFSGEQPVIGAFAGLLGGNTAYRAVEHRIYGAVFQRDNGILIDPYGRIMEDIAPEPEIVAGKIAFTEERTFYSKYGDIFSFIIVGLYVALLSYNLYLKRKSPYVFCKKCRTQIEKGTKVCPECGKKQK